MRDRSLQNNLNRYADENNAVVQMTWKLRANHSIVSIRLNVLQDAG